MEVATDYTCAALPKRAKLGPAAAAARARHHHHRGHRSGPYNHTLPPLPRQGLEPMDGDGDGVGAGGGGGGRKRQRKSSNPTAPPPGESLQLASGQRVKAGSRVKFLLPGRREPSFGKLKLDTGGEPTHAGSPQPRSPPPLHPRPPSSSLPAASPTSEEGTVWTIVKEQKKDHWEPQRASDSTNQRALASLNVVAAPKGELDTHGPCPPPARVAVGRRGWAHGLCATPLPPPSPPHTPTSIAETAG